MNVSSSSATDCVIVLQRLSGDYLNIPGDIWQLSFLSKNHFKLHFSTSLLQLTGMYQDTYQLRLSTRVFFSGIKYV